MIFLVKDDATHWSSYQSFWLQGMILLYTAHSRNLNAFFKPKKRERKQKRKKDESGDHVLSSRWRLQGLADC